MTEEKNNELKKVMKIMFIYMLFEFLATLLFFLGLFAKFTEGADQIHPLLANQNIVNGMIGIGIVLSTVFAHQIIKLIKKKNALESHVD